MIYDLVAIYNYTNFFNHFSFFTASDPTHGYVQYVDANIAQASGLAQVVASNQIYLGPDNSTILHYASDSFSANGYGSLTSTKSGRRSVRLESRQTFDQGILITDFAHIPIGVCGSWPAYWTYNYDEEPYGEVDIIEGANNQTGDELSLHTSARCRLDPDPRNQTGSDVRSDCSLATNYIDGCGVSGPPESYGDPFNALGGGVWALVIDKNDLAVWMFARAGIPDDILSGKQLTPSNWGKPLLHFKSHLGCRVFEQWKNQTIIFNIDFCGENAGGSNWYDSTSASSNQSCASSTGFPSCEAFVAANPQAFSNSYFLINSIKLYRLTTPTFSATVSRQGIADVRKPHSRAILILLAIAILFLMG